MELNPTVLQYLALAMKMPADASEPAAARPADEQADSLPASEVATEGGDHVPKSPKRKKRRFQPKRSPKKKAKTRPVQNLSEECKRDGENDGSEGEEE